MILRFATLFFIATAVFTGAVACADVGITRPEAESTLTTEQLREEAYEQSTYGYDVALDPALALQEAEAIDIMWRVIDGNGSGNENAIKAAGRNGHLGLVPVLVEVAARTFDPELALEISRALESVTGESVGGEFVLVEPWFSWMSRQNPPQVELEGYDEWKGQLLGTIDPSFKEFLYSDVPTRIPLWTVQWGGIVRDGIPPLEFPKVRAAADVDFLNPNEPVFGVTINGESRAYPHRIMGWHELANDRLGGELITFVF